MMALSITVLLGSCCSGTQEFGRPEIGLLPVVPALPGGGVDSHPAGWPDPQRPQPQTLPPCPGGTLEHRTNARPDP